jgi:hypothetical protein
MAARIEDVTSSRKGLLPQLVDVLHAMADSQKLLIHRIRKAQLERLSGRPLEVDQSPPVLGLAPEPADAPFLTIPTVRIPVCEQYDSSSPVTEEMRSDPAVATASIRLEEARQNKRKGESGSRSYNFFDELDARLADLPGPANRADETAS